VVYISLLGVPPVMLLAIMSIEVTWGTFIHAGERSLKTAGLVSKTFYHYTIAPQGTPCKKPIVRGHEFFAPFLPFWDWLFWYTSAIKG